MLWIFNVSKKEGAMLGIFAGTLQVLGYGLYIRQSLRHEIEPNAATWFMFAYGTFLLGILEFSRGAELELLYLPAMCATLGMGVAFICWRKGTLRWPEEWQDQFAFLVDVALTVCYVGALGLSASGVLDEGKRGYANLVFLVCSNLTTISSFAPLIRGAKRTERTLPWIVWACAYTVLGVATFGKEGLWTELMIYPVLNAYLHARVAWLARNRRSP